jgi:hypothetical protein
MLAMVCVCFLAGAVARRTWGEYTPVGFLEGWEGRCSMREGFPEHQKASRTSVNRFLEHQKASCTGVNRFLEDQKASRTGVNRFLEHQT